LLYQIFYTAAFLVAWVILVYQGYRRKFPMVTWILILASIRLAMVTGTRLFGWTPGEWQYMIENHVLLPVTQKTMFGGFLLGAVAYLGASRLLRFRHNAWDTVAYALPSAVAVQSAGCFFYGCCYGTASSLPWAVRYPVMSLAHYHQFEAGLIKYGDTLSLPVHPVQLYETAGALLVVLLVFLFRRRWKARGSLLISSVFFFSVIRFLMEFFRDPLSNKTGGEMLLGLKAVQWEYLSAAVLTALLLLLREKKYRPASMEVQSPEPAINTQLGLLLTLLLAFILLRNWFTLPEAVALNIAILPALLLTGVEVYRKFPTLKPRWAYALLLLMPLLLMSQTLPQPQADTTQAREYVRYKTIGGGYSGGSYTTERTSYTGSGCGRVTDTKYYHQKYSSGTVGYSQTRMTHDRSEILTFGGGITAGSFTEKYLEGGSTINGTLIDVNGFIRYDINWIGIGAGLHAGNLFYNRGDSFRENVDITTSHFQTPVFPSAYIRVGPQKFFFADLHIADNFPSSAPGLSFLTGIGTGLGLRNGLLLRAGASFIDENAWYVSAYLPIGDRIVIEPIYWWTGDVYSEYQGMFPENQFSIGISYRFDHK
jgi:phosphatidylglycerol:prolipoprotein diacylglycerol transferase